MKELGVQSYEQSSREKEQQVYIAPLPRWERRTRNQTGVSKAGGGGRRVFKVREDQEGLGGDLPFPLSELWALEGVTPPPLGSGVTVCC